MARAEMKKPKKKRRRGSSSVDEDYDGVEIDYPQTDSAFAVAVLERESKGGVFGWKRLRFNGMQRCLSPWCFLVCLCMLSVAHAFGTSGVLPASFTSLERRMNFDTSEIALIRMSCELGYLASLFPFLFMARQVIHRPRWIAFGGVVMAIGSIVCAQAHFVTPMTKKMEGAYCSPSSTNYTVTPADAERGCKGTPKALPLFLMSFGYMLVGIGAAPSMVLGITYLDENASHHSVSAVFTGIFATSELIGAALGYITAVNTEKLAGDAYTTGSFLIGNVPSYADRNWYGAWWLGMYINAGIAFIGAMWMFAFPSELPGSYNRRVAAARFAAWKRVPRKNHGADTPPVGPTLELAKTETEGGGRHGAFGAIVRNVTFWALVVESCCRQAAIGGFYVFFPKYVKLVFGAPDGFPQYFAVIVCLCAIVGLVFGTVYQRLLRLTVRGTIRLAMIGAASGVIFALVFMVKCPHRELAGYSEWYPNQTTSRTLTAPCNQHCGCSDQYLGLFCVNTGENRRTTFLSQCYAGCPNGTKDDGRNCTCVKAMIDSGGTGKDLGQKCEACQPTKRFAFLIGMAWYAIAAYFRSNPVQQATIRCVPFHSRLVALAISCAAYRLLAVIPGLFGVAGILHSACLLKRKVCDIEVVCDWYDAHVLAGMMVGFSIGLGALALVALVVAYLAYGKQKRLGDEMTTTSGVSSDEFSGGDSISVSLEHEPVLPTLKAK